jgi:putative addiction module component (TIGR02574 family)
MPRTAREIVEEALLLPELERDAIATALWKSLHNDVCDTNEEWEREWAAELERRCKEIDEGKVQMIPHEEVMATLRAKTFSRR